MPSEAALAAEEKLATAQCDLYKGHFPDVAAAANHDGVKE
jgi:hypothetical protein